MSLVENCNAIPLHASYYLFGAYFAAEEDENNDKTYPSWHSKTSLVGENISNIRPLAKVPMLNVTDNENPKQCGQLIMSLSYVHWVTESPINMGLLRS
ncbi:hypothetical protein [Vibrio parahaemolyticus]|uniref:hypothetical protein n=1 Tax=Vibrio parahaemolyticus TaxID=670 RepID=UPI001EF8B1E4